MGTLFLARRRAGEIFSFPRRHRLLVSAEGFEPSTSGLKGRCSTWLSYAPNSGEASANPRPGRWHIDNRTRVRQKPFVFNGLRSYAQSVRVCDSRLKGRLAAMFPAGCRGKNQAHPKERGPLSVSNSIKPIGGELIVGLRRAGGREPQASRRIARAAR